MKKLVAVIQVSLEVGIEVEEADSEKVDAVRRAIQTAIEQAPAVRVLQYGQPETRRIRE